MKALTALWLLLRGALHLLGGWWTIRTTFGRSTQAERQARVQRWAREFLRLWRIELRVHGQPPAHGPVLLVAHSLGCILTAWWAAHTRHAAKVRGALLVAPGDVERPDLAAQIHGWAPIARQPLPFPALLVGSRNDPYCSFERAEALAQAWGARFVDYGERGHINAESGLGDWAEGHGWLQQLAAARAMVRILFRNL